MPPWGAGPKPKKTPANTVRNSTYSTSNRFGGPPGTTTPGGPPGSGRASQISRPAMAAAAVAKRPNYGPPGTRTPGGPPGTGSPSQISRPSVPQPNRGYVSPAAVDRRATTQPSNTADRNMMNQARRAGPMDRGSVSQPNTPQASPYGTADRNMIAQANRAGAGSYDRTVFSPQELMQAATSGARTAPAAQAVQQASPYGTADRNMIAQAQRAGSMDRGSVSQPNTPQASPYSTADRNMIRQAQRTGSGAPTAAYQGPGPSANQLVQGSQGAQEWAENAVAAAPAWDPANNDPAMTDPVGMWTDPLSGGQMPDPADAEAWERMQRVADSEFGPGQDIYNPEYDMERFPTYDPSNTGGGWGGGGGLDTGGDWGGGYGGTGSGAGSGMGTFDPFTGEYLQFGGALAGNESQRGAIDEADAFWDLAHDRKWDETNRGIPGLFNSRGMLDSGLLGRAQGFSAADQNYEQSVQDWQVANQKAALDAQQAALEQQWTNYQSGNLFGNYTGGR